ncbi:hypothetical protein B0O99DRAFT_707271 [Bisporella sp. PMI_857]|nr:hypothetical protein B0O99DRAFT_707271 [Bisporella sp. PMI_857]
MKYETASILIAFFGLSYAAPHPKIIPARMLRGREVPQEHSHEKFITSVRASLNLDNVEGIADPIFGLLGNAAATGNCGTITNLDCCHQATADRAFTNAKAAGDVDAMADALIFQTLERNTGGVGVKSALCTDGAVNPEIAALTQHQDPASDGAAAGNKAIVLELAKQLASIGADPQLALESGTFEPGDLNDATGAGNTCDDLDDPVGCIFTLNRLVEDATAEEIDAAVAGVAAPVTSTVTVDPVAETAAAADECPAPVTATVTVDANNAEATAAPTATKSAAAEATEAATGTNNVQTFTGTLGGAPPAVESSAGDRPFSVNGNTFVNIGAALQRSCAIQNNACANAINSGALEGAVSDCNAQEQKCNAAASASARKVRRQTLDFGSCSDPSIIFEEGLDGRDQAAFIANDQSEFNHGSALNIGVIASFICGQLESKCKADAATVSACKEGQTAAANFSGQASADAFNDALGVTA